MSKFLFLKGEKMKVILLTLLIAIPISLTAKWEKIESPKSIQN